MAKSIRAKKLGKLEGRKIVGFSARVEDERVYIRIKRANGSVEDANLEVGYSIIVDGKIISESYVLKG